MHGDNGENHPVPNGKREQVSGGRVVVVAEPQDADNKREHRQRGQAATFLHRLFSINDPTDAKLDRLNHVAMMQTPLLRNVLMIPRNVIELLEQLPEKPDARGDRLPMLPAWLLMSDWPELTGLEGMGRISNRPDLAVKLAVAAPEIGPALETALDAGRDFPRPRRPDAVRLGFYAAALTAHGRYNRALKILHWLDECRPGLPDTAKRLANICWLTSSQDTALRWHRSAVNAAPDNALLHLSLAIRLTECGEASTAYAHLTRVEALWPELDLPLDLPQ